MNIITGCEKSRTVANAFEARGHWAFSIDIEPAYCPHPRHIQADLFKTLNTGAPSECRYLCSSGQHRTGKPGQRTQIDVDNAIEFFMRCVDVAQDLPAACIENSIGIMSKLYREPDQIIQPWQHGADASKATCLWLFGNIKDKRIEPTAFVAPRMVCQECFITSAWTAGIMPTANRMRLPCHCGGTMLPRWSNQTDTGQNRLGPSPDRSAKRADFYPGVARALANRWG